MSLAGEDIKPSLRWDGSFESERLEKSYLSRTWKRDCHQIHILTIPVAICVTFIVIIDAIVLGIDSTLFKIDAALRVASLALCGATWWVFRKPPASRRTLALPFATILSVYAITLFSMAVGANDLAIVTPNVIAATLVVWTFVPIRMSWLLMACGGLYFGFTAILLIGYSDNIQMIGTAPVVLLVINWAGYAYAKTRNISDRTNTVTADNLMATTERLKQQVEFRRHAEDQARINELTFRSVFESSPVALGLIDLDTHVISRANDQMATLLGFEPGQALDRRARHFFLKEEDYEDFARQSDNGTATHQGEVQLRRKDGSPIWILASSCRITLPDREATLVSFVDITDQKKKEAELAVATAQAKQANYAKSNFLATMSHELRTPLNAIIGFSDIIESQIFGKVENEKHMDYISDIKASGIHLLSIINEILDLSKIESGRNELYPELVDLNETINTAVRLVRHLAKEKAIVIDQRIEDQFSLFADERSIKQIILNLLSNAVKFSHEGGTISIHAYAHEGKVAIEVTDEGIGIPAESLETITDPFVQVASSDTSASSGTGLGLAIAKQLIELHEGQLEIESALGDGTTVRVTLPVVAETAERNRQSG